MTTTQKIWLSAYLYYATPDEALFTEALKPFVQKIFDHKLASQYFFIRYHERGPHIRLRFKTDIVQHPVLQKEIEAYFSEFFIKHPSVRTEPEHANPVWFPNNSVQFIPYEPEIERYGGEKGIGIAEEQFQASSDVVLAYLSDPTSHQYTAKLGIAVQLHLSMASALGMSLPEANAFFRFLSDHRNHAAEPSVLEKYKSVYTSQQQEMKEYVGRVWKESQSPEGFRRPFMDIWMREMKTTGETLKQAYKGKKLTFQPCIYLEQYAQSDHTSILPLWHILDSYIHMTNNRLGIKPMHENFLAFLLAQSLELFSKDYDKISAIKF